MPNLFLGAWALTVLGFLYLTTRRPPSTPLKPLTDGAQYEFDFTYDPLRETLGGVSTSDLFNGGPRWSQTPCGRTTHVRAWSDLH